MSVLSRNQYLSGQRIDLPDLLATDSYNKFDLRSILFGMTNQTSYIVRGFEVSGWSGLNLTIKVADAVVWSPNNSSTPFWQGQSTDADISVTLQASSTIYLELEFEETTREAVTRGFWDPTGTATNAAGSQFTESVDAQAVQTPVLRQRFGGFTEGAVKVAVLTTSPTTVTSVKDARELMFSLRRGGSTPDPFYSYPFATNRVEPPTITTTSTDLGESDPQSIYYNTDLAGQYLNDKGIKSFKEWMDAVMTVLKEIKGTPTWYQQASASSGFPSNLSTYSLLLDSQGGHSIVSDTSMTIVWSQDTGSGVGDTFLRSVGSSQIQWRSNYGRLSWMLGGVFVGLTTDRSYTTPTFLSATIPDGSSLYLKLEREAIKNSDPVVTWNPTVPLHAGSAVNKIQGVAGNFTGIAVGDYVRKESEGILNYYKVTAVWDGSSMNTTAGFVAPSVCDEIDVNATLTNSAEGYRYYRERYANTDLFVNDSSTITDVDYYWIGRRSGSTFFLRDFGNMHPGEAIEVLNDHDQAVDENALESMPIINLDQETTYTSSNELVRSLSGTLTRDTTPLLSIRRSKTINTINTSGTDNRRIITYNLINNLGAPANALTFANNGDELWVRLTDVASATAYTLSPGTIASGTDNAYEILAQTAAPLRTFSNRNVFMLAKRVDISGVPTIIFSDSQVIAQGNTIEKKRERIKRKSVNADYTVLDGDDLISVDCSGGAINITLPVITDSLDGVVVRIKDKTGNAQTNTITVTAGSGNTVDLGATAVIDYQYGGLELVAVKVDNNWELV